ncbi:MAG: ATP-binding protein [Leptospiraceae bacterium]|nr:ATP-binding protein [Leptospiraceae bacterium]MCK6382395.1 ATP-binding protein [Leptospiraceae bacterium]NUM41844.1 ATP-binding protein [Leptospiraceae bacterium]
MAFELSPVEIEKEIKTLLMNGLLGNSKDFAAWVQMETKRKFRELPSISVEAVTELLEKLKISGDVVSSKFDSREYTISEQLSSTLKVINSESYTLLGAHVFSPLQYVRSRLEYFLRRNQVSEEMTLDVSIAVIEAMENAVKYGDGEIIEIKYSLDKSKLFKISILNNIKEFNLQNDIDRGKFSSTATLMRGMMVMQKLFDKMDLDILENNKQALFTAEKKVN